MKIPEDKRPEFKVISDKLDARIPRYLQNIFVIDIQNDCDCSIEVYDSEPSKLAYCLSNDGIKLTIGDIISLPMVNDISEKDISNLLMTACENSSYDSGSDITLVKMLCNPKSDFQKVLSVYEKYLGYSFEMNRSGIVCGWIPLDFIPEDFVYLIPDPEFFGVLTANVDKFGSFCFSHAILKVELT